jgi:thiol-disulfide isomerase/thioredoxin
MLYFTICKRFLSFRYPGDSMLLFRVAATAALIISLAGLIYAESPATLEGFRPGSHINGPEFDVNDIKGRVVLVEYWGINCPICLANIPHLSELQEKYGRDHFVVMATHAQEGSDDQVRSVFKSKGGSDKITVMQRCKLSGGSGKVLPQCYLFDHQGKLVFQGFPDALDQPLESAIKNNPGFLVVGRSYQKTEKQAAAIGALKSNLANTVKSLRKLVDGEDAVAKDEAQYLLGKLAEYAARNNDYINKGRSENPQGTVDLVARMVSLFGGDELGKPFEELAKTLKADKLFQAELRSASILAGIQERAAKIGMYTNIEEAKRNRQAVTQISEEIMLLLKKFPDTRAAAKAKELTAKWSL